MYQIRKKRLHFYDVGGQRGLRKQWVHYFDDANVVLFITSIASYSEFFTKGEDVHRSNKLVDAVRLFADIAQHKLLLKAGLVLFLNKADLLAQRLEKIPFKHIFPNYNGPNTESAVVQHVHREFSKGVPKGRSLVVHKTCCLDTKGMNIILDSIISNTFARNLESIGLLN